jgi:hypothetical protein
LQARSAVFVVVTSTPCFGNRQANVYARLVRPSAPLLRSFIAECLHSMRAILEGIAGSLIATGIVHEIDRVVKMLGN